MLASYPWMTARVAVGIYWQAFRLWLKRTPFYVHPAKRTAAEATDLRVAYYGYVNEGDEPKISVIQDLDGPRAGHGAFWGEVQSNVHKALGCLGVVTDGCIRDIPD